MAHDHLRLHLPHRLERDADDVRPGAAEAREVACEKWKCAMKIDGATETAARNSAPEREPVRRVEDEAPPSAAWADAGDVAVVLARLSAWSTGLKTTDGRSRSSS